jgi:hypothetical protein
MDQSNVHGHNNSLVITTLKPDLWDQRNKDHHGIDTSTKAVILREQAVHEIEILYTYQDKVLQRHHTIFTKDIAYHT